MLCKFRKSFSEDARRIRPFLNNTVDLHVKAVDHYRNPITSSQCRRNPAIFVRIRQQNPAIFVRIQSAQILATKLIVFRPPSQNGQLAEKSKPERPNSDWLARSGQNISARTTGFQRFYQFSASMPKPSRSGLNSCSFGWNPTNPDFDETVRIPAFIL
jgi:hypothetical protein